METWYEKSNSIVRTVRTRTGNYSRVWRLAFSRWSCFGGATHLTLVQRWNDGCCCWCVYWSVVGDWWIACRYRHGARSDGTGAGALSLRHALFVWRTSRAHDAVSWWTLGTAGRTALRQASAADGRLSAMVGQ